MKENWCWQIFRSVFKFKECRNSNAAELEFCDVRFDFGELRKRCSSICLITGLLQQLFRFNTHAVRSGMEHMARKIRMTSTNEFDETLGNGLRLCERNHR